MPGKIYITQPIIADAVEFLKRETPLELNTEDRVLSRRELVDNLSRVDGAVTLLTDTIDEELLTATPNLKVVSNVAVGYNNIDVDAATRLGVMVTNTPGVLTDTTADFAWTLLMAAARRLPESERYTRARKYKAWGLQLFLGHDVYGKTLGIVGLGRIGQAVARRAAGFNMNIVYFDPMPVAADVAQGLGAKAVAFDELLRISDFISLHVPLEAETRHLLNDAAFAKMKANCIVVNSARGPVIDEKALVRALKAGTIAAAALDVYEREPEIEPELLELDNVVLAPHIASASRETRLKMCMMAAENVLAALDGRRPPNLVNPDVWDKRRALRK